MEGSQPHRSVNRYRPLVLVSVVVGLLAHFGIFLLIRIELPTSRKDLPEQAAVQFMGDAEEGPEGVVREQSILFDSAPLFMPTRLNLVSVMDQVASLREATEAFSLFPPRLSLPERLPGVSSVVDSGLVSLEQRLPGGTSFFLAKLGRGPLPSTDAVSPVGNVQALRLDASIPPPALSLPLPGALQGTAPDTLWSAARLHLQMVNGRPVGLPLVAQSSGFTDWDRALQVYVGSLSFYGNLPDGYFGITVFP